MGRTNKQIQDEYSAKGGLSQMGIAADDLIRLAAGGLTGGMLDRALGGDNVERTREAAVRSGVAGDIANVGGMVLGLKGAGGLINGARSIPVALRAAASAGPMTGLRVLTNTAGPGLIPAAGAAISKTTAAKGAGILAALGLSAAGRQDDTTPAVASVAAPTARVLTEPRPAATGQLPIAVTQEDQARAAFSAILSQPFTARAFRTAASALPEVVAASGGKVSNKDKVYGATSGISDALYQSELAQASKLTGEAKDNAVRTARENFRKSLLGNIGIDPAKQALADLLAQQQEN